ncbi:MinD/ParA family protein [Curtobacterium sp. KT1]|uniref:MinD/ParA family ATP-binding protein n=1 Tax=Curtobacterium sp. KT1 TaxID=3372858 RepID=UPI0037BE6349
MLDDRGPSLPPRIFTWVDAEQHLQRLLRLQQWPDWLQEADGFWDALVLRTSAAVNAAEASAWLESVFGIQSIDRTGEAPQLRLQGTREGAYSDRALPIVVELANSEVATGRRTPTWAVRRVARTSTDSITPSSRSLPSNLQFLAFHSYKGGVGRTLHAVAAARAASGDGKRVLLVDGDLEAPGISWMYEQEGRETAFAYEDFLALVHASRVPNHEDAVAIAAEQITNQSIADVYFLPARRDLTRVDPARIEPNNLFTPRTSPFVLTDTLADLAVQLGVDVVIVDLRAGASELAASLLLDARLKHIFVTTVSEQSVRGAIQIIEAVRKLAPKRAADPLDATLISQYRRGHHDVLVEGVAAMLQEALSPAGTSDASDVQIDSTLLSEPILSPFKEDLLGLPAAWSAVTARIDDAGLQLVVADLLVRTAHLQSTDADSPSSRATSPVREARKAVTELADALVFAETANGSEFLPTDSMERLLEAHRTEAPISVVIGAKGAGKTFTQLQMLFRDTWSAYAAEVGISGVRLDHTLIPTLVSRNLQDATAQRVADLARDRANSLGGTASDGLSIAISDAVSDALGRGESFSDSDWRRLWLWCCARSAGFDVSPETVEQQLIEASVNHRAIFLIDGLEDLLQYVASDSSQQRALRVLLVDTLDWLRALRGRPFGLIAFVRRDLVQGAVVQNTGQFFARYRDYELRWNPSEALRLALWVVSRAAPQWAIPQDQILRATEGELSDALIPVWGEKMGGVGSREARSENWFLAALSDFNAQIQARDIVIFMRESARLSEGDSRWNDRLLAPAAMRNALLGCSDQKISAMQQESPQVGEVFERLKELPEAHRQIPFRQEDVRLQKHEIDLLQANGVIFREEDQFWIPEIFRHGLKFRAIGRPRVLAIASLIRKRSSQGG